VVGVRIPAEAWDDVEEGTEALLEQWLVREGDVVAAGQPVATAILVKTNYEIVAPAAGRIAKILVAAQGTFGRGQDLALLEEAAVGQPPGGAAASPASPDAPALTRTAPAEAAVTERMPLSGLRGIIARNMTLAWQTVPRVAAGLEVDVTAGLATRNSLQERLGPEPHISLTHLILRAVALTLREHPRLNARVIEGAVEVLGDINLGLAVNLADGLVVPVLRHADRKSVVELAAEARRLAEAAREGRLPAAALQGGTFTVTNLGATGIDWFTPIVHQPEVAILGVGRVAERAVVRDGRVVVAPTMTLTLVYDHRGVDGYPASLFLAAVGDRLARAQEL
jgi:pyruvate/2-oxoglutarate dehydrogenase complex dihydrolipoamide acyltransferase (E2) component